MSPDLLEGFIKRGEILIVKNVVTKLSLIEVSLIELVSITSKVTEQEHKKN